MRAIFKEFAFGAGLIPLLVHAIPYDTIGTMGKFYTGFSTAGAIDHFRGYVGAELNLPFLGGLRAQIIVISRRGYVGITGGTIQAATCNQLFHRSSLL